MRSRCRSSRRTSVPSGGTSAEREAARNGAVEGRGARERAPDRHLHRFHRGRRGDPDVPHRRNGECEGPQAGVGRIHRRNRGGEGPGLYGAGQDLLKDSFSGNVKGMGPAVAEMEIEERPNEPFVLFAADKTDPGAYNLPSYLGFADPMFSSGLILSRRWGRASPSASWTSRTRKGTR